MGLSMENFNPEPSKQAEEVFFSKKWQNMPIDLNIFLFQTAI